jgi:hypothetical protein
LENLQFAYKPGPKSKCLQISSIEEKLEQVIRLNGEKELNAFRDRARKISETLHLEKGFERLNKIVSALLSTYTAKALKSPLAAATAVGAAYDPARLELFQELFRLLSSTEFKLRPDRNKTPASFRNFAFFESYFSNYIEGTKFEVEEAHQIIETSTPIPARNDDSHDVLGTFQLVSNKKEMSLIPTSYEEFIDMLQYRHRVLLSSRTDKKPGLFKDRDNFAGSTSFVSFDLVRGTLKQGFTLYKALEHPFARAAYLMFFLSEVHPFLDGNGRIARVFMNAELARVDESKIIIPTVYRDDYVGALRKLTRQSSPDAYIRMLQRAQEFSENIYGDDWHEMHRYLISCNAFKEHTEGKLRIIPTPDEKLMLIEKELGIIDPNETIHEEFNENVFFNIFDSWLSDLMRKLLPVGQHFNKYFREMHHHIFVYNGIGAVKFKDNASEEIITLLREECVKNRNKIGQNSKVELKFSFEKLRQGGLKRIQIASSFKIEFGEDGYKVLMDEFSEGTTLPDVPQFEQRLLHKPITEKESDDFAKKVMDTLRDELDYFTKKQGIR